jgi:RNA polymerase sigma-70 factor
MMAATPCMPPNDDRGPSLPADVVDRLYRRSGAEHWKLPRERFGEVLRRGVGHRFPAGPPDDATLRAFLDALHLEDLALACACRDGSEAAWAHFARAIQPQLRIAGRAMAGAQGEELADALMADLFGSTTLDGERRSLLDYFHGRSRLTTWLRTVLAQRHVDRVRAARREVPLEGPGPAAPEPAVAWTVDRPRLLAAFTEQLTRAVDALDAGDRLRLAYYHVHGLTLARIGRLTGEHESSVSRKLDRARRQVRAQVERALRDEHGFGDDDLQQCYADAGQYGTVDLARLFREPPTQDPHGTAFKPQDVS